MWKLHDFSVTQILREINFGEYRSSKNAVLAILGALKMIDLVNFSFEKVQKFITIKLRPSENYKIANSALLESP